MPNCNIAGPAPNLKTTMDWTHDGRELIIGRGPETDDVVLIEDFY